MVRMPVISNCSVSRSLQNAQRLPTQGRQAYCGPDINSSCLCSSSETFFRPYLGVGLFPEGVAWLVPAVTDKVVPTAGTAITNMKRRIIATGLPGIYQLNFPAVATC